MKIYTSYFAKYKGVKGLAVSNSVPKNVTCARCGEVAPPWEWVDALKRDEISWESFYLQYYYWLKEHDRWKVLLPFLADGVVLLCWEKNYHRCHRSILAAVLDEYGIEVEEL